jgi:hypothetical protein
MGRTCSVLLKRRGGRPGEHDREEDRREDGEEKEMEFQMIDGKGIGDA